MLKRVCLFILASGMVLLAAACARGETQETPAPSELPEATPDAERFVPFDAAEYPIGMIYSGGGDMLQKTAQHGFLRTCESLGYPAHLFSSGTPEGMMDEALQKGCKGVVVWAGADVAPALKKAGEAGIPTVAVYGRVDDNLASVNLFTDNNDDDVEAVKLIKQELEKRKHPSGAFVLVTDARSDKAEVEAMRKAIRQEAAGYTLLEYSVSGADAETSRAEAVQYYKENTHIVAAVCFGDDLAALWTGARKQAEADLKPTPTPKGKATPTPTPTPSGNTPAPTPVTKLDTVIVGMDYTKENIALTKSGALYGFIARPYFNAGAQGCILLDQLLRGSQVPSQYALYAPLVRKDGCDKYESIVNEVFEWFGG